MRNDRGHTQKDVADAIGRSVQFVCDVEHGRRGHRMDPVLALLWCEFLVVDADFFFSHLGYGSTEMDRFRVQHHLETSTWAHRFVRGKRDLEKAAQIMDELALLLPRGHEKDLGSEIVRLLSSANKALRIPRIREKEFADDEDRYEVLDSAG